MNTPNGHAFGLFIHSPLSLYAVKKEVTFVLKKPVSLRLKETSVTGNHYSARRRPRRFRKLPPQEEVI